MSAPVVATQIVELDGKLWQALEDAHSQQVGPTSSEIPGWGQVHGFHAVSDTGERRFIASSSGPFPTSLVSGEGPTVTTQKLDAELIERAKAGEYMNAWEAARIVFLARDPWWSQAPVGGWDEPDGAPECDEGLPDRGPPY